MTKKTIYHTLMTSGYTVQRGDDHRACGGVTHTEVAITPRGAYLIRRTDSNGKHRSSGRAKAVTIGALLEVIDTAVRRGADNGGMSAGEAQTLMDRLALHRMPVLQLNGN